ncbi:MAG: hypothetical protein QOJ11_2968 [Frankiales bacterium]|jgi:hypothetical protein|nr:hypothetical protein [Frankiales bacterium]
MADHKRDKLDVAQTLTAWAAAQAWRETDPDAERASDLAEDRLHDLRPAAITRYDDLRAEGFDPVTAMRQVVPLLETNPRVGKAAPVRAALSQDSNRDLGLDEGRMPDTGQSRDLANELNTEYAGYEPPYRLSGYELKYGVEDRMAPWPHRGFDDDPTMPEATPASTVVDPMTVIAVETVLLAEMEAHHDAAARATNTAAAENHLAEQLSATPDDLRSPRVDGHVEAVTQAQPHLVAVEAAGTTATFERNAEQAIASSYPRALTDVGAVAATAARTAPVDLTATLATKQAAKPVPL